MAMQTSRSSYLAFQRPSARPLKVFCAASDHQKGSTWQRSQNIGLKVLTVVGTTSAAIAINAFDALAVSGGGGLGTSLSGKDFSGQNLQNQKLYKADMRGTNFSKADLTNANLFGALAKGANFSGANLTNADIETVDFEGADLSDANLTGAQAINAQFKNANIENTDWTDAVLRRDVQRQLCAIASGTNTQTGVDTKESLLCP